MSKKVSKFKITTLFKWLLIAIISLFAIKIVVGVVSALTVGMALVSMVLWGLGIIAVGGGVLFLGLKLFSGKKK